MHAQRARLIPILTTPALLLAGAGAMAPAADAATSTLPAVKTFTPVVVSVGDKLSIEGTRFRVGVGKNTVVFKRDGRKAVFVKVTAPATKKRLSVIVPKSLETMLKVKNGVKVPTRFRIRILAARFGKSYTAMAASPVISPGKLATGISIPAPVLTDTLFPTDGALISAIDATIPTVPTVPVIAPVGSIDPVSIDPNQPGAAPKDVVCTIGTPAPGDADGDALSDTTEGVIGTNPQCLDTDGDGVLDGYEYLSALDLNPIAYAQGDEKLINYQNALDAKDADTDFDGDGLTQIEEQKAWILEGKSVPLSYSDGKPASTGGLRDGDRDVDLDGLSNWAEQHGPLTPEWWKSAYKEETAYVTRTYAALSAFKKDTDADGIDDFNDDEDHDGYTNGVEAYRVPEWATTYVSTEHPGDRNPPLEANPKARVNPFNPCKPTFSSFCHDHPPFGAYPEDEDWISPYRVNGP